MSVPATCIFCSDLNEAGRFKPHRPCKIDPYTLNKSEQCQACFELEQVEIEIAEEMKVVEKLIERHREIRTKINQAHDHMVQKIPLEIISYIFQLSMPPLPFDNNLKNVAAAPPVVLGAVCKAWRRITLSTPRLWNLLKIRISDTEWDPNLQEKYDFAREQLDRCRGVPVLIGLYAFKGMHIQDHDAASNIIKDIVQCSDRWHVLDLECYNDSFSYFAGQVQSASALHTLRLSILDTPLDDCVLKLANARPTEVDLSNTLLKSIDINWDRATSVRLRGPRLNECFQLLTLAPQLKRYTLSAIRQPEAGHAAPSVPITHHAIQELILEDSTNDLIQLLNMISFPSLQTLSYEGWDQLNPEVLHFLARSSCLLRELTISKPYSFLYEKLPLFTPSLREIPSLRKFECFPEIESVAANDILALLAGTFTENGSNPQGAFLPNLEHLKITVSPSKEIEWRNLARVVELHNDSQNAGRGLQTVKIHFNVLQSDFQHERDIDEDSLRRLREAWKSGFDLEVGSAVHTNSIRDSQGLPSEVQQ